MKKTEYSDAPSSVKKSLETATVIADFLPPPEKLVRKTKKEKITILLDADCVDFFRALHGIKIYRHNTCERTITTSMKALSLIRR